jgi:phosphatidylinositol alpha-1,6-mannosyltransferase
VAGGLAGLCRERGAGFRVLHLGPPTDALGAIPVRHFSGRRAALAAAVAAAQRGGGTALVFDHLGPARVQAWLPAPLRAPYLLWMLGIEVWGQLAADRRRALAGAAVRLAISEHTRRRALDDAPAIGPVEVLHPALEERAAAEEPGPADAARLDRLGEGFVLIVGRMAAAERYKGHDELLEALAGLAASHPGARLVVAGGGDDRERLQAKAAALGLGPRVDFTGFVSEPALAELYRRAGIFALPSRDEGFGLVYLEAMRAGKPCLAARGGAAEEIVVDGETGRLVTFGSAAEIAAALAGLLDDPRAAARMGEEGRRRYLSRFGGEAFHRGLAGALDRLLGHVRH